MDAVVCGIDPGLRVTGYAVIRCHHDAIAVLDAGVCRLDQKLSLSERLLVLENDITSVLAEYKPMAVAIEALYSHYNHPRTAILMGHARGVLMLAAAKSHAMVHSFSATKIKRFLTGNGHASKIQMQSAIQAMLSLPELPEPPDVADALAAALCCVNELQAGREMVQAL